MKISPNINNSVTSDLKLIFKDKLLKVILYGSYARGDETDESDIDYIVLTTLDEVDIKNYSQKIVDLSYEYLNEYGTLFSFVIVNSKHFNVYSDTLPYYNNIVKEGMVLYG